MVLNINRDFLLFLNKFRFDLKPLVGVFALRQGKSSKKNLRNR